MLDRRCVSGGYCICETGGRGVCTGERDGKLRTKLQSGGIPLIINMKYGSNVRLEQVEQELRETIYMLASCKAGMHRVQDNMTCIQA